MYDYLMLDYTDYYIGIDNNRDKSRSIKIYLMIKNTAQRVNAIHGHFTLT